MFNIGDKIVYPTHGAGIIESIAERETDGKTEHFYIMRMISSDMTIMIPVNNCDSIGIRSVMNKSEAQKVLDTFKSEPIIEYPNWNKRHRENMRKIKSGDIYEILQVVKDLMYRDRSKGLSTSERKMLNSTKQIIVSELVLSTLGDKDEIENIMLNSIDDMIAN